jgi:hypothetical protein
MSCNFLRTVCNTFVHCWMTDETNYSVRNKKAGVLNHADAGGVLNHNAQSTLGL